MTAIAQELDLKLQAVDGATAHRLERLVREALAFVDAAAPEGNVNGGSRVERLFAAMDGVKEFSAAGKLTRDELHAR
jgi:hypothetical protein